MIEKYEQHVENEDGLKYEGVKFENMYREEAGHVQYMDEVMQQISREFIFANSVKRHICDVQNSRLDHALPTTVYASFFFFIFAILRK